MTALISLVLGAAQAANLPVPEIDSSTIRIVPGPALTFQFQASGQAANAYVIETAPGFASNGSWNEAAGAAIVAVAEGLFRVTLPMQGKRWHASAS